MDEYKAIVLKKETLYTIYGLDNDMIIIKGNNQTGNDYIISRCGILLKQYIANIDRNCIIWVHGYDSSPHFILYKMFEHKDVDPEKIERFIRSHLKGINNSKPLTCSKLSDIKKTNIVGLVEVPKPKKLNQLL